MRITSALTLTLAAALACSGAAAKPLALRDLYRPFRTEQAVLSPDGRHVAYTLREDDSLYLAIIDADHPEKPRVIPIGEDLLERRWPIPIVYRAAVSTLRWATPDLLLYGKVIPNAKDKRRPVQIELRVVDPTGKHDRKLVDQNDLSVAIGLPAAAAPPALIPRPPRFLGFSLDNPAIAFVEAAGGGEDDYITNGFAVDLRTGKLTRYFDREAQANFLCDANGHARLEQDSRIFQPFIPDPSVSAYPPPSSRIRPRAFHYRPADGGGSTEWDKFATGFTPPAPTFTHEDHIHYQPRALPLAFAADPNVLYVASNLGRDTFGLYAFDLKAKTRTPFALEIDRLDLAAPSDVFSERMLIFDRNRRLLGVKLDDPLRSAHWLDEEFSGVQQMLDERFPGRRVALVDWDEARRRFLVLVTGWSDPGRYYLWRKDRPDGLLELFPRASRLPAAALHRSDSFSFDTPAGVRLSGHLTLPRGVRIDPPPLLFYCRDIPGRPRTGFDRDAQAFAAMGFVVAEVNYRGSAGFGLRHREAAKAAFDRVPIEDLRATIDWLAQRYPFNRRRVALFGERVGGYLALRALQLHPDEFRCAISLDAPADLASWRNETRDRSGLVEEHIAHRRAFFTGDLKEISLLREPERFVKPVFILQSGSGLHAWTGQGTSLRDALERHNRTVEYWEIPGELRGEPDERAKMVSRIGDFLNEHVYDFGVGIGELKEVK